jgi:8-oxo-dGTP pyrophosphatase MutT (NUDIX family)
MIRINIVDNDISTVAKVVLIDEKNRVLFLKRSSYVKKFANEWDLPGGHLKQNETLESGLSREVYEETGLDVRDPMFITQIDNLHFFYAPYDSQQIRLSHEHIDYKFFKKNELDLSEKFQKVALKALEKKQVESFYNKR